MYEQIRKNKIKSTLIITLFWVFLNFVGFVVALSFDLLDNVYSTILITNLIAVIYILFTLSTSTSIIMRLNHAKKINREDNLFLWNTVENLCLVAQLPLPNIYIIQEGSPNAFATGMSPDKASIAVTTGLLEKLNREEIEAVIAHELAHIANRDCKISTIAIALISIIILILDIALHVKDSDNDSNIGVLLILVLYLSSPLIGNLLALALSRNREYLADSTAVHYCRNPQALISALEKISQDSDPVDNISPSCAMLYFDEPTKKNLNKYRDSSLFDTHPPVYKRIAALRNM